MKNFISLGFVIFSALCIGQNKENRIESYPYILDNRQIKTSVFDKMGILSLEVIFGIINTE